jgi:hypothetical protein
MAKDQLFMLGGGRNLLLTCSHGALPLAVHICSLLLIGQWDFRAKKEGRAHMCVAGGSGDCLLGWRAVNSESGGRGNDAVSLF